MARQRITKADVWDTMSDVSRLLDAQGLEVPTLYLGDKVNGVTNKLMCERRNLWPDAMAGHTIREAYNALRVMRATLGAVADKQDRPGCSCGMADRGAPGHEGHEDA